MKRDKGIKKYCIGSSFLLVSVILPLFSFGGAETEAQSIKRSKYGNVISVDSSYIKNAVVEHVHIYPQKNLFSRKRITRKGVLIRYPQAEGTILLCHGFMCDKFDTGALRGLFSGGRFNFMSFDFRAHGEYNEGQCCTFGRDEAYDVIAAAHFLRDHPDLKGEPLFVYGFSMGAASAIEAQAKDSSLFDAMILDCPFDSSENVLRRNLENVKYSIFGYEFTLPGKAILHRYAFHPYIQALVKLVLKSISHIDAKRINVNICSVNPAESIKSVSVPCFFIHCKNDDKISVDSIRLIYKNAASLYKKLWLTNGRRHFDSYFYNPEKYTRRVQQFFCRALDGKLYDKQKISEDKDEYAISFMKKE